MANISIYTLLHIWDKARSVPGYDPNIWRKDFAGAWIRKDSYGLHSQYGWEIDYLKPLSRGGTSDKTNLIALHWRNNNTKGTDYPIFNTSITSKGDRNIEKLKKWEIR